MTGSRRHDSAPSPIDYQAAGRALAERTRAEQGLATPTTSVSVLRFWLAMTAPSESGHGAPNRSLRAPAQRRGDGRSDPPATLTFDSPRAEP